MITRPVTWSSAPEEVADPGQRRALRSRGRGSSRALTAASSPCARTSGSPRRAGCARSSAGRAGQSVGCAVRPRSRTIAAMLSAASDWPARTAEWQASVAARRSRGPATVHSPSSRSRRSRSSRSRAGAGIPRPQQRGHGARRASTPPPKASTSKPSSASVVEACASSTGRRSGAELDHDRARAGSATPPAPRRASASSPRSGRARARCAGRRGRRSSPSRRHDVGVAVLARARGGDEGTARHRPLRPLEAARPRPRSRTRYAAADASGRCPGSV